MEIIQNKLGFEHSFVEDCLGRGGGIAMLWRTELNADFHNYSRTISQ